MQHDIDATITEIVFSTNTISSIKNPIMIELFINFDIKCIYLNGRHK